MKLGFGIVWQSVGGKEGAKRSSEIVPFYLFSLYSAEFSDQKPQRKRMLLRIYHLTVGNMNQMQQFRLFLVLGRSAI